MDSDSKLRMFFQKYHAFFVNITLLIIIRLKEAKMISINDNGVLDTLCLLNDLIS